MNVLSVHRCVPDSANVRYVRKIAEELQSEESGRRGSPKLIRKNRMRIDKEYEK